MKQLDLTKGQLFGLIALILFSSLYSLLVIHPIWSSMLLLLLVGFIVFAPKSHKPIFVAIISICAGNIAMSLGFSYSLSTFLTIPQELAVIFNRLYLLVYCFIFILFSFIIGDPTPRLAHGTFRGTMRFPFIWFGPQIPIWSFIVVGGTSNIIAYLFFIDLSIFTSSLLIQILLYAFLFALINAVLEEIFWRGFILPKLSLFFGQTIGLVLTSVVFGFYHYSFGMPWYICLVFIIGGLYMGDL